MPSTDATKHTGSIDREPHVPAEGAAEVSVCLVDDDPIINFVTRKTIENNFKQIKIREFTSPSQALAHLLGNQYAPDVLFLDINMPQMDGWQLLEQLAPQLPSHVQVYMLSSSIDPKDRNQAAQYSIVKGFFSKPLTVAQMENLLTTTKKV
jgi:CheY-like chemotaxis protein